MKNKDVREGMLVQLKDDFGEYANAGDICEVILFETDGSHLLLNKRTGIEFYRNSSAYRKAPKTKE